MNSPYTQANASLDAAIVCWGYDAISQFVAHNFVNDASLFRAIDIVESYYKLLVLFATKQGFEHASRYTSRAFNTDSFDMVIAAIIRLHAHGYRGFDIATMHALAKGD